MKKGEILQLIKKSEAEQNPKYFRNYERYEQIRKMAEEGDQDEEIDDEAIFQILHPRLPLENLIKVLKGLGN